MPSFILKTLDFPSNPDDIRSKLKPLYDKKSNRLIQDELSHVKSDKNFHVIMMLNTRENYRRQKSVSRFKTLLCLESTHYRKIFKKDQLYVFYLNSHFFFASDTCKNNHFLNYCVL